MRQSWSDDRLDLLGQRIDQRFAQVESRLDGLNDKVDRLNATFMAVHRSQSYFATMITVAITIGFLGNITALVLAGWLSG